MPDAATLMPVVLVAAPHPSVLAQETLLSQTQNRFQRRSGPGGQHRNKTSSGVFLLHEPTGVSAEATERRSQADNRAVAAFRLRVRLAIVVRTASTLGVSPLGELTEPSGDAEQSIRDAYRGSSMKINDANDAKPAVLALLLNDFHVSGGQPSLVAQHWSASSSAVLKLVKSHPEAFIWVNSVRLHHGRRILK